MQDTLIRKFAGQANDVLSAILGQSPDCIKLVNLDGEIEYVNPNGLRVLGVTAFDQIIGKSWVELWPSEAQERVAEALDKARRGQHDRFEGYCPTATGEARWWDVSVSPITGDGGEIAHILATSRDITARMQERMNEELLRRRAQDKAHRADDVAREMRHRLKNQLAVVGSITKLLSRNSESATDLAAKLEDKIQALAKAQDLLTMDRERPIAADEAIREVLGASGESNRILIGDLPAVRLGDESMQQLALILGELQTNSLKYGTLSGSDGRITLTGTLRGTVLCLHWHEDTGRKVAPPQTEGGGYKLLTRLGSANGAKAHIDWHERGPAIDFSVKILSED